MRQSTPHTTDAEAQHDRRTVAGLEIINGGGTRGQWRGGAPVRSGGKAPEADDIKNYRKHRLTRPLH